MKWEYKFLALAWRTDDAINTLNSLGDERWEVINLVHGVSENNHVWLKREKVPDQSQHTRIDKRLREARDRADEGDNSISDGTNG